MLLFNTHHKIPSSGVHTTHHTRTDKLSGVYQTDNEAHRRVGLIANTNIELHIWTEHCASASASCRLGHSRRRETFGVQNGLGQNYGPPKLKCHLMSLEPCAVEAYSRFKLWKRRCCLVTKYATYCWCLSLNLDSKGHVCRISFLIFSINFIKH